MQPIQDKDLDKLFKNAFEDAEIVPSGDLWSSIEGKIDTKKKRIVPVYWLSAAAILLVATVGFLIYQQQETQPKQLAARVEPKTGIPDVKLPKVTDLVKVSDRPVAQNIQVSATTSPAFQAVAGVKVNKKNKPLEKQELVTAPEMQKQETLIAKVEEPKQDIRSKIDAAILETEKPLIAANPSAFKGDEVTGDDNQVESKGIRNVGDVVNLIVNKMDKRKDKLIQFRTDDDDSSVSSINIGPFRFGKKNKR